MRIIAIETEFELNQCVLGWYSEIIDPVNCSIYGVHVITLMAMSTAVCTARLESFLIFSNYIKTADEIGRKTLFSR